MTASATSEQKLLSVIEVSRILSCSRNHVYGLIARGGLKAIDIRSYGKKSKIRIRVTDLEDFLTKRTL